MLINWYTQDQNSYNDLEKKKRILLSYCFWVFLILTCIYEINYVLITEKGAI